MLELQKYPDIFEYFQPTLEWQLASYPPHGWYWAAYAGEMRRTAPAQVMYDQNSLSRWSEFLRALPGAWRSAIKEEFEGTQLENVPPPEMAAAERFSAHRLAWARYRSCLMGDYFADVYRHLKPRAGSMQLLIPEVMPLPLIDSGLPLASLGHNPEYWLACGDMRHAHR